MREVNGYRVIVKQELNKRAKKEKHDFGGK